MTQRNLFGQAQLPPELEEFLRRTNPWWEGKPGPELPPYRRWAFHTVKKKLETGFAPIVLLRGPRQVGKTKLQEQLIEQYLKEGVKSHHILRVQFDEIRPLLGRELTTPILSLAWWFEDRILGKTFNEAARANEHAYLFFDEVQNLSQWAPELKSLVDHHTVRVLATGSSALRIEAGRDSLAGRITQVDLGMLLLREIAGLKFSEEIAPHLPLNGLEPLLDPATWRGLRKYGMELRDARDRAFREFSEFGGYPFAHTGTGRVWPEIADQLNENVIRRVIQHDLRMGERGRKRDQQLLEEVFRLACRYAGQSPDSALFTQEIHRVLRRNIDWQRVLAYLKFLDGSLLLALIPPLEIRVKRTMAKSKICLCDHALRASWLEEVVPLEASKLSTSHTADLAGHIAESVVGYFLRGLPHLDVAHFPQRGIEPEVDFVLTIGARRIPLEVKYRQHIDPHRDTLGLRSFLEKTVYNAPFGILVTMHDDVDVPDPRIISLSLPSLMLLR